MVINFVLVMRLENFLITYSLLNGAPAAIGRAGEKY